jgi:hypothetical protein
VKTPARTNHIFLGVLALALVALHVFWFWELYAEIAMEGLTPGSFGQGRLFFANLLIFVAVLGALVCLLYAAIRSFRAGPSSSYLPSLLLMGAGTLAPWFGIALSWFVAGDAL